jgi:GT2 family glycosyltransferase
MKVAVVILCWNGKKYLAQFLPSLLKYTHAPLSTIVVADNCSTDDSVEYVRQNFPSVQIIQNSSNTGFAGGYNQALKQVNAEYYVLLNQDVEVTENWIEQVISEMEKDSKIAAAQPKLKAFNNRSYFEYAGAAGGYVDRFGYAFCRGRIFDVMEKDEGQYDTLKEIFWASGACMFVRSEIYWQAGGLDEDFFAHQEEIDLCWRIRNLRYKVICVPQSVVYHVGGGSLPQGNPRKTFLNFRNNMMMMFKNLPLRSLIWKLPVRTFLDLVAAIYSVIKNKNLADCRAIAKGELAFFKSIPSLVRKRRQIPHSSAVHLSPVSIVWQYFICHKKKYSQLRLEN